jgi:hypothetical protein
MVASYSVGEPETAGFACSMEVILGSAHAARGVA